MRSCEVAIIWLELSWTGICKHHHFKQKKETTCRIRWEWKHWSILQNVCQILSSESDFWPLWILFPFLPEKSWKLETEQVDLCFVLERKGPLYFFSFFFKLRCFCWGVHRESWNCPMPVTETTSTSIGRRNPPWISLHYSCQELERSAGRHVHRFSPNNHVQSIRYLRNGTICFPLRPCCCL